MNTQDDGASRHVKNWIKNFDAIATSEKRKTALSIMSAGFDAIDTKHVIRAAISLSGSADARHCPILAVRFSALKANHMSLPNLTPSALSVSAKWSVKQWPLSSLSWATG